MKRKDYKQPTIKIVKLQHRTALLQASADASVSAKRSGYGEAINDNWDDESE